MYLEAFVLLLALHIPVFSLYYELYAFCMQVYEFRHFVIGANATLTARTRAAV